MTPSQHPVRTSRALRWFVLLACIPIVTGCKEEKAPPPRAGSAGGVAERPTSPAQIAELLRDLHRRRAYTEIERFIAPAQRAGVLEVLNAVDAVVDADARLRAAAADRYGGGHAVAWDLSGIQNNLGVFSRDTDVISQSFQGDSAEVALQEGDHVPLVRAPFELRDGTWHYLPDLPPPGVVRELIDLARVIDGITADVEAGADFGEYLEAFPNRMVPQLTLVVTAGESSDPFARSRPARALAEGAEE